MPKKKGGKKGKKSGGESSVKRPLQFAEDMEEYAKIIKCLGDRRVIIILTDSTEIMGLIPGRFRKRVWMSVGDIVLISKREFEKDKVDIIHKYNQEEVRKLHKNHEIPEFFLDTEAKQNEDDNIEFVAGDDDDIDNFYINDGNNNNSESDSSEELNIDEI